MLTDGCKTTLGRELIVYERQPSVQALNNLDKKKGSRQSMGNGGKTPTLKRLLYRVRNTAALRRKLKESVAENAVRRPRLFTCLDLGLRKPRNLGIHDLSNCQTAVSGKESQSHVMFSTLNLTTMIW